MKKIIRLLILSAVSLHTLSSWATSCSVNNGPIFALRGGAFTDVNVQPVPISGGIYSYGDLKLKCQFDGNNTAHEDYINTDTNALSLPWSSVTGGLLVGAQRYDQPVVKGVRVATLPGGRGMINIDVTPFITPVGNPLSLNIAAGSTIAELRLFQNNNYSSSGDTLGLRIRTASAITFWPNTCTINGGSPLDINFADVIDSKISTNPTAPGQYTKPISLTYSCTDKSVTQAIGITLKAPSTASFNNNLIGTSNSALGVALVKGNGVVPVNSTYNAQMVNGDGTDSVTFNLVRSPSGVLPATGDFTASAVLQIGLP